MRSSCSKSRLSEYMVVLLPSLSKQSSESLLTFAAASYVVIAAATCCLI